MNELPLAAHDIDAEREVLGACLLTKAARGTAAELLSPEDFFHPVNRKIYRAIHGLESAGGEVGLWEVSEALSGDDEFRLSGGAPFLASLSDGIARASSVAGACGRVRSLAQRREITAMTHGAADKANDATVSNAAIVDDLAAGVDAIREGYYSAGRAEHVAEVGKIVGPMLNELSEKRGSVMFGSPTGFLRLDAIIPGWVPGEMVTLAARPSAGKSALAVEFALRQARMGKAVAFYSLEMSKQLLYLRLACREGRVDFQALVSGRLGDGGWDVLVQAVSRIGELPIWIDARPVVRATELRWRLRSLAHREKIRLAVVDYMQLLRAEGENRTAQVTKISIELKAAAREMGELSEGTLIAVSQLNRIAANELPQLHHLRESGQIEQDSDVVMFLYDEKDLGGRTEKVLRIAKQRNGPCDEIRLAFTGPCMGFEQA
jgi:replicative DNA helicase